MHGKFLLQIFRDMSTHQISFESDVQSLSIEEEYVLAGLKDGSVCCIDIKVNNLSMIDGIENLYGFRQSLTA